MFVSSASNSAACLPSMWRNPQPTVEAVSAAPQRSVLLPDDIDDFAVRLYVASDVWFDPDEGHCLSSSRGLLLDDGAPRAQFSGQSFY